MAQVFPLTAPEGAVDEVEGALVATLMALPEEWVLLRQRRIGDTALAVVLIHPGIGIALVDIAPKPPESAEAALRDRLEQDGFARFFPGELAIVRVAIGAEELDAVGKRLEAAFAAAPRLAIDDPDWADAVVELLLQPEDVAMAPVRGFAEAIPTPHVPPPPFTEPEAAPEPEPPPRVLRQEPPPPRVEERIRREPPPEPRYYATLRGEPPIGYDAPQRRRPGRSAAIALGAMAVIGIAIAGWSYSDDDSAPGQALRQAEITVPMAATTQSAPTPPPATAAKTEPPPLPPAPSVMLAAKPMAEPPPPAPHPTEVAALPPPVKAAPPPAPTPPIRQVAVPAHPAGHPPQREARGNGRAKARPQRQARVEAPPQPRPPQRQAQAPDSASQTMMQQELNPGDAAETGSRAPPIDAADLPPLPSASAAPAPARAPAVNNSAAALGPPVQLIRQPVPTPPPPPTVGGSSAPAPTASAAPATRECRPYTSSTTLTGQSLPVQGIACREADGQWRVVSEVPVR